MRHDDKLALGRELNRLLLERHGTAAIAAVGIHGGAARVQDDPGTDLSLAVVTAQPQAGVPERLLRHRGVVVDIGVIWRDDYLEEARHIGPAWPLAAEQYLHQLPLHDPETFFAELRATHEHAVHAAGEEVFAAAAGYDLVQATAWQARAEAAMAAGDAAGAQVALKEAVVLVAMVAGLLARTPFHDAVHAVRSAATSPGMPKAAATAYRIAVSPGADAGGAVTAMGRVLDELLSLAAAKSVPVEAREPADFL